MSGHSKWSTIKRQKGANDAKRGQLFSKLARSITIAAKQGGSDPVSNLPLRLAIDQAKSANMPKSNIDRALQSAQDKLAGNLEEITYEGFGPFGVSVMVETATDNKNRTAQEIKKLFGLGGGSLGGKGSVSFQFEQKGLIVVEKGTDVEKTILSLIDLGTPDLEETDDGIEVYTSPHELAGWRERIEKGGFQIQSANLVFKPKAFIDVADQGKAKKVLSFLEGLDNHDDVQRVYANFNITS
ncbi:YebC/PmpR family DNA-binding transcriptional regulator [Candidatus Woesebacteria bacterium]|nr:YebC/PmpR family DNA-binding transcriptional regulator [Candidatus Woesebacteria bacterium]